MQPSHVNPQEDIDSKERNFQKEYLNIFEAASEALIIFDAETSFVVEANPAAYEMYGYSRIEFIGVNAVVFMRSESDSLFKDRVNLVKTDKAIESPVVHLRKDGMKFHVEIRKSLIAYNGRLCLLCSMRDVSQRVQTEKNLSDQIEARNREQATLLAISHTLASTLELQPGLILDQLREIVQFTHGGLFALEDSTLVTLSMRGTELLEKSAPVSIHFNTPEKLSVLFNQHHPTLIADIWSKDDPQAIFLRAFLADDAAILLEDMQSWMWVPLAVRGRIIGCIGIAQASKDYFTAHHAELALSVANQAAITMINAELYKSAKDLAVLEERQNLARNLHDAVNQSLFSAGLITEVLPRLWERDQDAARHSLEDLRRLTRGAMAEMRALLAELRPSTLVDSSLSDLLRLLGNAFSGRTNIPVTLNIQAELFLPAEAQIAFYRVCQEALINISKHAKATQVEIDFQQKDSAIEMRIHDNGLGFDANKIFAGHYGLGMMRERAESVGAELTIASQPTRGAELILRWILNPADKIST